ncbi:MAG: DUF1189 family protein, partial [Minisyncoccia bacterium]
MNFFRTIKSSIYHPEFYQSELLNQPISFSFKYFFNLIIVLSLILTIILSIDLVPKINLFFQNLGQNILKYYPQDLVITISKGEAKTNMPTPYFLVWPKEIEVPPDQISNLLVIDTQNDFAIEKFKEYKAAILLTKNNLIYLKDNQIIVEDLKNVPDIVIDYKFVSMLVEKMDVFKKFIVPIIIFGLFFGFIFVYSAKLLYLLIGALIIMLILKILKFDINYKKSYQIGLQ